MRERETVADIHRDRQRHRDGRGERKQNRMEDIKMFSVSSSLSRKIIKRQARKRFLHKSRRKREI